MFSVTDANPIPAAATRSATRPVIGDTAERYPSRYISSAWLAATAASSSDHGNGFMPASSRTSLMKLKHLFGRPSIDRIVGRLDRLELDSLVSIDQHPAPAHQVFEGRDDLGDRTARHLRQNPAWQRVRSCQRPHDSRLLQGVAKTADGKDPGDRDHDREQKHTPGSRQSRSSDAVGEVETGKLHDPAQGPRHQAQGEPDPGKQKEPGPEPGPLGGDTKTVGDEITDRSRQPEGDSCTEDETDEIQQLSNEAAAPNPAPEASQGCPHDRKSITKLCEAASP